MFSWVFECRMRRQMTHVPQVLKMVEAIAGRYVVYDTGTQHLLEEVGGWYLYVVRDDLQRG